ncbi:hypothetical protein ACFRFU_19905 [Streptomyces sp. NPDC056704]|uniref:hypothetical protein n=1 Tax=Streptomyces sp. NPDC056704 TaxID=3345917 RepID=UPI0036BE9CBA
MKILWTLVAIFLGCLSLGGLLSAAHGGGWFDLIVAAILGWTAVRVWKAARS